MINPDFISGHQLRKLVTPLMRIRGVPWMVWRSRRIWFRQKIALIETPDEIILAIERDDYAQLMMYFLSYCSELSSLIRDSLLPGDYCIDLGANVGYFTYLMAKTVGESGQVIAVEPNSRALSLLKLVQEQSPQGQVLAVEAAIGADTGTGSLTGRIGASQSFEVAPSDQKPADIETEVSIITVDQLLAEHSQFKEPDFIKVDIEGSEVHLLKSMRKLLDRGVRPIVLIEFHPEKCERRGIHAREPILDLLDEGYSFRHVQVAGFGYALRHGNLSEPICHSNLLFATDTHLAQRASLRAEWNRVG